jgi:hypothetical protein
LHNLAHRLLDRAPDPLVFDDPAIGTLANGFDVRRRLHAALE